MQGYVKKALQGGWKTNVDAFSDDIYSATLDEFPDGAEQGRYTEQGIENPITHHRHGAHTVLITRPTIKIDMGNDGTVDETVDLTLPANRGTIAGIANWGGAYNN
jgi:hypothetical protein